MASKLDANQLIVVEHDEASGSKKVKIVDTVMEINIDEDDGDSAAVRPVAFEFNMTVGGPAVDVTKVNSARVYFTATAASTGSIAIEISPSASGTDFVEISTVATALSSGQLAVSAPFQPLARRLRIVQKTATPVGTVRLIGQG